MYWAIVYYTKEIFYFGDSIKKHPNPFKIKYQTFVYRVRNQNMNMKDAMEKHTAD